MISDRRRFLGAATGAVVATGAAVERLQPKYHVNYRRRRSLVAVLSCDTYSEKIEDLLLDG